MKLTWTSVSNASNALNPIPVCNHHPKLIPGRRNGCEEGGMGVRNECEKGGTVSSRMGVRNGCEETGTVSTRMSVRKEEWV